MSSKPDILNNIQLYKLPDGIEVTGLTPLDVTILSMLPTFASKLREDLRCPKLNRIVGNINQKLGCRGLQWKITSIRQKKDFYYALAPLIPEGIPNPVAPGDFIDEAEALTERAKLRPESPGYKELWATQAERHKKRVAPGLAQTILTTLAFSGEGTNKLEQNLLTFLGGILPSSDLAPTTLEKQVNLGLLAVNDPRVKKITEKEAFVLFNALMDLTLTEIQNYWDKNEATTGAEIVIIQAVKSLKKIPGLTPEIIIKLVNAHFKPKTNSP